MRRREFLSVVAGSLCAKSRSLDEDFGSARDAAAAVAARKISADELTAHIMKRIDRLDAKINAICWRFNPPVQGASQGPFAGVPMTVKESYGVVGSPATWGLAENKEYRSKTNAVAVQRMLDAGARIIGKTNVPERLLDLQSYNAVYGTTNNPWNLAYTCGGSSGGSAAALAAGFGFMSVGSDIGGSLRIPSHFCGICAHKPSLELIPRRGHAAGALSDAAYAVPADLSVVGPMARYARDLALMMQVLAGPEDQIQWSAPKARHGSLREFRAGAMIDDSAVPLTAASQAVLESALTAIEKAGVRIERRWPEGLDPRSSMATYKSLLYSAVGLMPDRKHSDWMSDTAERFRIRHIWQEYFKSHDVFLCPVAFTEAFPHDHSPDMEKRKIGGRRYLDISYWQHFPVLAGLPSTVIPVGRTSTGLPVGIQVIGPYLEDFTPIEFAALLEPVIGGFTSPPNFA